MEYEMKKVYNKAGWIYMIFLLVTFLVQLPLAFFFDKMGIVTEENRFIVSTVANCISMYGVAFSICCVLFSRIPVSRSGVQQEKWGLGKCIVYFLICVSCMYIGNIIGNVLMWFTGMATGNGMPSNNLTELVMGSSVWLNLIALVVFAPIVEEWLFRKFLLDRIAGFGQLGAAVMSAFLFALAHGNFYQFFYAFGLGFLFAYIYMKTGKVRYSIILHMAINFMGSILAPGLLKWQLASMQKDLMIQFIVTICVATYGFLLLGGVIAGVVLLICNRKQISFLSGENRTSKKETVKAVIASPGIWCYTLFCVLLFVQATLS